MVSFSWTVPPADTSTSDPIIPLGDTAVQISYVRTLDTVDRVYDTVNGVDYNSYLREWVYAHARTRYSLGANNYWADYVYDSSGQYAAAGYGHKVDEGVCPAYYQGEPDDVQISLGPQPSNTTSIKAGSVFLVGRTHHVNSPIYPDNGDMTNPSQGKGTAYYGSLNISTAQTIQADFPWAKFDTTNVCAGKLDSSGKLIISDYGTEDRTVRTQYAYDRNGRVGRYDGFTYTYLYKNGSLVWFNGAMAQDSTDKIGHSCADDILDIMSDRSDTSWTDPNTGIKYKLKLWGFVNNGSSQECRPDLEKAETSELGERFITCERAVSYGRLYGSIEQKRPVTFAKDVKAGSSAQGSLTIPTFNYINVPPEGAFGAKNWGIPKSLTPIWNAEDVDPEGYILLAPNGAAMVQETGTTPQAAVDQNIGDVWTTGWSPCDVSRTVGKGSAPLLRRGGTTRLDRSDFVDLDQRIVRLDETQLAERQDEVAVKCVWHNEYVVGRGRVTLVNIVDGGSARPEQWTLIIKFATDGLFGQKTITGASGMSAVSKVHTVGGTYGLSAGNGPDGYSQNGPWVCTDDGGNNVSVSADNKSALGEGKNVTCVMHQKPQQVPVSAVKSVEGAPDAATVGSYSLSYTCIPGPDGKGTSTGKTTVDTQGNAANLSAQRVGVTYTVTEDVCDARGFKQPGTPADGSVSQEDPAAFKMVIDPGNQEWELASTAMVPTNGNAGGVTFTMPDSTQDAVWIKVVNPVVPHAGIDETFSKVTKSTEKVSGRTTFDQTYTITVTNPSTKAGLTYDLNDAWQVPTGVTVHKISISGDAINGTETPQAGVPYVKTGIFLPTGQKHTYTAVLNVSGPDVGLPGTQGTCIPSAVGQGKVIYNKVPVTTKGDGQPKETAIRGTLPANPQFKVSKTPLDVVRNDDGTFISSYTVMVTNTPLVASPVVVDPTNTLQIPADTYLHKVRILEKGADVQGVTPPERNDAIGTFDGPITLIKGGIGESLATASWAGADGGSRTFTMQMIFTARENAPGYNESDFQCGHQHADSKPSGLVNTIAMEDNTDGEGNNHGCLPTDGKLKFSKEATTQSGNGSTFDAIHTVSMVNEGSLTVLTGPINGKLSLASRFNPTLVKVQCEMEPTRTVQPRADGSYRLSDNETLYSGLAIRYTVTFTVEIDPSATGYNDELLACTTDKGCPAPGRGLHNKVIPQTGKDSDTRSDHDVACADVSPNANKRILSIVKTGSQGSLDDAVFDLYPVDPSTPGAKPLTDGVAFTGGKGTGIFITTGLTANREYWLVGTKAPAGHRLMAKPARFKVIDTGIELTTATPGGLALTISRSGTSKFDDTIIVRDLQIGALPPSGGCGIGMNIVAGTAAITGAGLPVLRQRKISSFGCSA